MWKFLSVCACCVTRDFSNQSSIKTFRHFLDALKIFPCSSYSTLIACLVASKHVPLSTTSKKTSCIKLRSTSLHFLLLWSSATYTHESNLHCLFSKLCCVGGDLLATRMTKGNVKISIRLFLMYKDNYMLIDCICIV